MAELTVLVVEHEAGAPGGWLAEELSAAGCHLDVRKPYAGEPLPGDEELATIAGVVVLGGSMAAWDDTVAPWLPDARRLVRGAEAAGVPTLGICLGHQLAATALGGTAAPNPAGPTLAVVPVCWAATTGDDAMFAAIRDSAVAVHWNNDVVAVLPPGAEVLARSPDGQVQAARLGAHVWGVQFHPEAGPGIIARWAREGGAAYVEAGHDVEGYLAEVRRHETELRDDCRRLARSYLSLMRAR